MINGTKPEYTLATLFEMQEQLEVQRSRHLWEKIMPKCNEVIVGKVVVFGTAGSLRPDENWVKMFYKPEAFIEKADGFWINDGPLP